MDLSLPTWHLLCVKDAHCTSHVISGCVAGTMLLILNSRASFSVLICPPIDRIHRSTRPLDCDSPIGDLSGIVSPFQYCFTALHSSSILDSWSLFMVTLLYPSESRFFTTVFTMPSYLPFFFTTCANAIPLFESCITNIGLSLASTPSFSFPSPTSPSSAFISPLLPMKQ